MLMRSIIAFHRFIICLIIVTSGTQSLSTAGAIPNSEGFSLQPARLKMQKDVRNHNLFIEKEERLR